MGSTSDPVKRRGDISGLVRGKMNVDQGRIQGLVSHEIFDGQQVCPVFIKVGPKSVPERVAGDPVLPSKEIFMGSYMTADIKSINGTGRIGLFRKKPFRWTTVFKPVSGKEIQGLLGKDGVAVGTAFGMGDMDPHIFAFDITVTEVTDFPYPESCRVHEGDHGFRLEVRESGDKNISFLLSWDKGQIRIELPHRELGGIPGFVQHIHGKEAELRNTGIDCAVRKRTFLLQPADIIPEIIPGDVLWLFQKNRLQILQIRTDVSGIRFYGMVSKTAERDHLPISFKIVHDRASLKRYSNRTTGSGSFKAAVLEKDKICSC